MHRYFKRIDGVGSGDYIYYWQSKGLSDERINPIKHLTMELLQNEVFMY